MPVWASAGETKTPVNAKASKIGRSMGVLPNWIVDRDEFGAVGKGRFHLHLANHVHDAFHHLIGGEYFSASGHELGYRLAVTRPFQDEVRYDRDAFGIIQLDASRQAPASDQRRKGDHELVSFPRCEVHDY